MVAVEVLLVLLLLLVELLVTGLPLLVQSQFLVVVAVEIRVVTAAAVAVALADHLVLVVEALDKMDPLVVEEVVVLEVVITPVLQHLFLALAQLTMVMGILVCSLNLLLQLVLLLQLKEQELHLVQTLEH